MAKNKDRSNPNIHKLWPVTVLTKRFSHYQQVNPALLELFYEHRDREQRSPKQAYASRDDLLEQYPVNADLRDLVTFIRDGIFEVASEVNAPYWDKRAQVDVKLTGLWFQISNGYSFHETHVHGNCSWSGVYYVQAGSSTPSADALKEGQTPNGITRFYGPHMEYMAGGHGDYGNFYVQDSSWDSYPQDGKLCIFPSYLKHMVYPYNGEQDRVIVSFHAQVNVAGGMQYNYSFGN